MTLPPRRPEPGPFYAGLARVETGPQSRDIAILIAMSTPDDIRRAVADELAEPKYRLDEPWWTELVTSLERAWVRFLEWAIQVSEYVGGPLVLALLVGITLVVLAVFVTANLGKRRARAVDERIRREHEVSRGLDPEVLESRARQAEIAGDHATAFRLLFRAALIRLDRAGAIDLRPSSTSTTLSETLHSEQFDLVAQRFDAIAYGDKPAHPGDLAAVRRVVDELLGQSIR